MSGGGIDVGQLINQFQTAQTAVQTQIQSMQKGTNVNVADYMKLQVQMNSLSQIGSLITNTVQVINKMVSQSIAAFPTH